MRGLRIISTLVIASILILRGGDCIPLLFANQATKDCCTKGKCSRSQKADPCCQTSSSDAVQHFQAEDKVNLPALAELDFGFAVSCWPGSMPVLHAQSFVLDISPHPPPDPLVRLSLPLLI